MTEIFPPTQRARNYTDTEGARSLHATFVANVFKRLGELGRLHTMSERRDDGLAKGNAVGRPDYEWLTAQSGIPRRTLENLLNLHNQPTMVGAAKIAAALCVGLDTLLGQEDFGRIVPSTGALECIHATGTDRVCPACLSKWQSYQRRLRTLYEERRAADTAQWETNNINVRAEQLRTAGLPEDTDER